MQFRPALTALALSAMLAAGAAQAGDVQVYGLVDLGISATRASGNGPNARDGGWNVSMKSGMRNSSRFGLRGSEDLGNGWRTGFTLESQFKADSGTLQTSGTLWEREASVYLSSPYGKVTMGRLGKLRSPVGTTGLCTTNNVNPFGNSMSSFVAGHKTMTAGNYFPHNNSVVYQTPKLLDGLEFFLQYSLGDETDDGTADANDRYMAAAARYFSGPLKVTFIVDTIDLADASSRSDQPTTVNLAVNYNFGFVQPFLYVQYFHSSALNSIGADSESGYMKPTGDYDGVGGMFTLRTPVGGGLAKLGLGYLTAERSHNAEKADVTRASVAVGYDYTFSKTFHVYADAGYVQQKTETATDSATLRGTEFLVGCVKYF